MEDTRPGEFLPIAQRSAWTAQQSIKVHGMHHASHSTILPACDRLMPTPGRYEAATEEVTKWQPIVKANREAPTLHLNQVKDGPQRASSIAALTASFKPQTDMEKDIEAMLRAAGAGTSSKVEEGEEALALKVSPWTGLGIKMGVIFVITRS